jgi:hypothetical protein
MYPPPHRTRKAWHSSALSCILLLISRPLSGALRVLCAGARTHAHASHVSAATEARSKHEQGIVHGRADAKKTH